MHKNGIRLLASAGMAAGFLAATLGAGAQTMQGPVVTIPSCGYWASGVWHPATDINGNARCPNAQGMLPHRRAFVSGTITRVDGHLVTVQQSTGTVVINDQPALNRKLSGHVAVGRQVVAIGHWRGGTFYATNIQNGPLTAVEYDGDGDNDGD